MVCYFASILFYFVRSVNNFRIENRPGVVGIKFEETHEASIVEGLEVFRQGFDWRGE
ncbi:hypothetical protein AALP_AA8G422200 [Arabis alpina]|uniref:Uncharacterized protein n=1 Tax=Arabis alpina TaxID=50452 RepID=A0A087GCY0_ARAAL|nr:hypothetical protein AALP_AA8G422200 [Arabis alpina]